MSKFTEVGSMDGDIGGRTQAPLQQQQPVRNGQYSAAGQSAVYQDDDHASQDYDDDISLNSQDLEMGKLQGGGHAKKGGAREKIKQFVAQKTNHIAEFDTKAFVETKKHQLNTFSLEEFMSDKRHIMIRAALGEFVVTSMFIFIVCAVGINTWRAGHDSSEMMIVSAVCTGFAAVALIYSFADVSGAHFNPAVTFSTIVTGKTTVAKGVIYIAAQCLGSMFAMLLLTIVFPPKIKDGVAYSIPQELVVQPAKDANLARSFMMEVVLSFILVYVIFATAFDTVETHTAVKVLDDHGHAVDAKKRRNAMTIYTTSGNSKSGFAPLSIGFTLGFLCFLGGSVSGGAFNPARVFGAGVCAWTFDYMWLYWVADFIGASLAGLLHQRVFATSLLHQKTARVQQQQQQQQQQVAGAVNVQ